MEENDNQAWGLLDDLAEAIQPGCSVCVCSSGFSIYAYQALQDQLDCCASFRFVYLPLAESVKQTEQENKTRRVAQEHSVDGFLGTEGELATHPELTQKVLSEECLQWMQRSGQFRMVHGAARKAHFILITPPRGRGVPLAYNRVRTFTLDTLCKAQLQIDAASEQENTAEEKDSGTVHFYAGKSAARYQKVFDELWQDPNAVDITAGLLYTLQMASDEAAPELIYYRTLYLLFRDFVLRVSEDALIQDHESLGHSATWNALFAFQRDAAVAIISKLEQYNGCILADSVGLGKTFTALAVIQYYERKGEKALVLCPKRLRGNWLAFRAQNSANPLMADHLSYDVLYHTDLLREKGDTDIGKRIETIDWGSYSLIVIDESHNFRNGTDKVKKVDGRRKANRYSALMHHILEDGLPKKVLMLTATPVNNSFRDLRNQLALVFRDPQGEFAERLMVRGTLTGVFRSAQRAFNAWQEGNDHSSETLALTMNPGFYTVMDAMSIARSRSQIQQFYDLSELGPFPQRRPPLSLQPPLVLGRGALQYGEAYHTLANLIMAAYAPGLFLYPEKRAKYRDKKQDKKLRFELVRGLGVQKVMAILVMKRMESSVHSFTLTITRLIRYMRGVLGEIEKFWASGNGEITLMQEREIPEEEDDSTEVISASSVSLDLNDVDCKAWKEMITCDVESLEALLPMVRAITPERDNKLHTLKQLIREKVRKPFNARNRKVLVFTAYADTARYLFENLSPMAKRELGVNTGLVVGSEPAISTIPSVRGDAERILSSFSPISMERDVNYPQDKESIDILIATDCVSEGQNLQDCDYCINYDIHWNPVRIIQRFGRVDRIGSHNEVIQLVNFWPDMNLDVYLKLKDRVEDRMKAVVLASSGEDNPIETESDRRKKQEAEYRREQLVRLRKEIVNEDEVAGGVPTAELTMSEFHTDIIAHMGEYLDIESVPSGLYAVVKGETPGVIFVLRHKYPNRFPDMMNRFRPYYVVYVRDDGSILYDHLHASKSLYAMRLYSINQKRPDAKACAMMDRETRHRRDMSRIDTLLQAAMSSIVRVQRESVVSSLFRAGGTTFFSAKITGPADLELAQYLVVR